jgi:adenylate kinase family enzyme
VDVDRVIVVGPSGSGKTTLARDVASRLGVRHTEMDALWWEPNWRECGPDELRTRLLTMADESDRWVTDGNYFSIAARDAVWPRADTVVFLDLPRRITISRIIRRSVRHYVRRTRLWSGNRVKLSTFYRRDELLRFAWREYPKYRERYLRIREDPELAHLTVIRLGSPRAVRAWLEEVGTRCRTPRG